jgi:hypothetical protein
VVGRCRRRGHVVVAVWSGPPPPPSRARQARQQGAGRGSGRPRALRFFSRSASLRWVHAGQAVPGTGAVPGTDRAFVPGTSWAVPGTDGDVSGLAEAHDKLLGAMDGQRRLALGQEQESAVRILACEGADEPQFVSLQAVAERLDRRAAMEPGGRPQCGARPAGAKPTPCAAKSAVGGGPENISSF